MKLDKDNNLVAVFGTLKKGLSNHCVMERARGELVSEDYIEFNNISGNGFPIVSFKEGTNRFLKCEIYSVSSEGILGPLDCLEGYPSFYGRELFETINGKKVIAYTYVGNVLNNNQEFLIETKDNKKFYEWK